ncbi:unnamed protein product [Meganyctiphanes norvegica]|uniref:Uncharacterized protein n=1 Tax=Meganyctiphanes norvegica TaxID=48144 RepID=A0AAV2QDL8_MEGNR
MAMTGLLVKRLQGDKREYYTHEDSPKVNDTQGGVAAGELHPKAREALEGVSSSEEPESSSATAATLPADIAERGPRDAAGTGGSKTSLGGEQAEAGAGGPGHHRPASPMRHVKRIGAAVAKGVRSCWAHICG